MSDGAAMLDWLEERGVPRNSAIAWVYAKLGMTQTAIAQKYNVTVPRISVLCEKMPHDFATAEDLVAHYDSITAAAERMNRGRRGRTGGK